MSQSVYIETYGCQMNEYDSQIVKTILSKNNYSLCTAPEDADVILLNTCSVRENAHQKVKQRISTLKNLRREKSNLIMGVLGCMAQNLKKDLFDNGLKIDLVVGPDSYKELPSLLNNIVESGEREFALSLSDYETYADIFPTDTQAGVNAWIAVMRGCDNFCTFCVVPYTRGRERCRDPHNIIDEVQALANKGFKQVTLLGQNVNSYKYDEYTFAKLINAVSEIDGIERIRFTSPHPKDFPDDLLEVVADNPKACKQIHLPVQSGNTRVLKMMNRTYSSQEFYDLVEKMKIRIPNLVLTTDIIVGFPTETESEYLDTLELVKNIEFDSAFMFKYSERQGTTAHSRYPDDISDEIKTDRIVKLVDIQRKISFKKNQPHLGQTFKVIVEGSAKKQDQMMGRNDGNKIIVFPANGESVGDCINVKIEDVTPNTLIGIKV